MHILLTDVLTCPRCGPDFGLLVLADRLEERQIEEGRLGCPNCRHAYPILRGVADLRHEVSPPLSIPVEPPDEGDDRAFRAAALLGLSGSNATVAVIERAGSLAPRVAEILTDAHVVGCSAEFPVVRPTEGVLSRIVSGERLPFRGGSLRGAAVLGRPSSGLVRELGRLLLPGSRIVVDRTPAELADTLESGAFEVLLQQDGVTVAAVPARG